MLLSFICPSLVIRFGDSILVIVPPAFCCCLRLFPVQFHVAVHRDWSPRVPRAAPQDLWSSEFSSQLCPARVPCGSWALSLGSIPAFRTQNTSLLFRTPCPQTWPASLGLGCWIWGWDVLEHVLVTWVQLPNRSGWLWINWHPDLYQTCLICERYRLCFSGVFC